VSAAQVSTLIGSEAKGQNSVLLTGYGAYGISDDPEFDYRRLPLLDRGVVFAVAHIRGGGEVEFVFFASSSSFLITQCFGLYRVRIRWGATGTKAAST